MPATEAFDTPAPGGRFVAVQVRVRNTGSIAYDDTPDNCATLIDTAGHGFEATTLYALAQGPLFDSSVILARGAEKVGYIVFDVPRTSKVAAVDFALDSGYADESARWRTS
jgi:hypothetical protein